VVEREGVGVVFWEGNVVCMRFGTMQGKDPRKRKLGSPIVLERKRKKRGRVNVLVEWGDKKKDPTSTTLTPTKRKRENMKLRE